jgi:hypothetical protein
MFPIAALTLPLLFMASCHDANQLQQDPWRFMAIDYSPHEAYRPKELRKLADDTDRDHAERRRMLWLILRAAGEKDPQFRDLIGRTDLRRDHEFDLALAGYDYAVNANGKALDFILKEDAKLSRGGDHSTIQVMSFLDEWERTPPVIRTHEAHADGTGGTAVTAFWLTRKHFFPEHYAAFQRKESAAATR